MLSKNNFHPYPSSSSEFFKMSMTVEDCAIVRQPKPIPDTATNVFDQLSMKSKLVAITGASDGIGLAVAEAIAEAGGDLALLYNTNTNAIQQAERLMKLHNIQAKALKVDEIA